MQIEKWFVIAKSLIKAIVPGIVSNPPSTGGTSESRYCYSCWLRNLILLHKQGIGIPSTVAELGPGDSLGMGIAALLTGTEKYYAMDIYQYWDPAKNLQMFDELVDLFKTRPPLPKEDEFPNVLPRMDNYDFPEYLLPEVMFETLLSDERLSSIRTQLMKEGNNEYISYFVPWNDPGIIKKESIDLIFSQSVLQFVEIDPTYKAMYEWLKPGGAMFHVIDFTSNGITKTWSGHWTFSTNEWKLFSIGKKMLLNRAPLSGHLKMLDKYNFQLLNLLSYHKENTLQKENLSLPFELSEKDLNIYAAYYLAQKEIRSEPA